MQVIWGEAKVTKPGEVVVAKSSKPPMAPAQPPTPLADAPDPRESLAAKERRLLEWEAELNKREEGLDDG